MKLKEIIKTNVNEHIETICKIPLIMGGGLKVLSPDEIEVRNKLRIDVI